MCRETLKGHLQTRVAAESPLAIEEFIDKHDPSNIQNAEGVLEAIRTIRVCDPACGSGAYLVGMLHELLDLRACLFATKKLDAKSVYDRKLEIIQTNIYGVDIDQFAVNIARLRLWLSLAVDFEGTKPQPLPNLDYKVEVGDSLLGQNPSGGLELGFRKQLIDQFLTAKTDFLTAHHSHKKKLKPTIDKLKADIASFGGHASTQGFDWAVEFAEVFIESGFDIVISNPPYVRIQELSTTAPDILPWLKEHYRSAQKGNYDLYVVFVERGLQLLSPTGHFAYILPHKFFNAQYGEPLRKLISEGPYLEHVVHFGDLQVFSSATNYVCLLFMNKGTAASCLWEKVDNLQEWMTTFRGMERIVAPEHFSGAAWNISIGADSDLFERLMGGGAKLSDLTDRIFQGLKTGADKVYIVEEIKRTRGRVTIYSPETETEYALEPDLLHPLIKGGDSHRFRITTTNRLILFPYSKGEDGVTTLISQRIFSSAYPLTWEYLRANRRSLACFMHERF
jgi:hypothetical protein